MHSIKNAQHVDRLHVQTTFFDICTSSVTSIAPWRVVFCSRPELKNEEKVTKEMMKEEMKRNDLDEVLFGGRDVLLSLLLGDLLKLLLQVRVPACHTSSVSTSGERGGYPPRGRTGRHRGRPSLRAPSSSSP